MTEFEILSIIIASLAFMVATLGAIFNSRQVKKATHANLISQQVERGNAVMHFTNRYHELTKEATILTKFNDPSWSFGYWGLLAIEFYFYHNGVIPVFIFSLWMAELSDFLGSENGASISRSQTQFLETYSAIYPEMVIFYNEIHSISSEKRTRNLRHQRIAEHVKGMARQPA